MTDQADVAARTARTRALRRISAARDGRAGLYARRYGPTAEADLLAYAARLDDEVILEWRDTGPAILRWIREHQPASPPPANTSTTLAEVMKRTAWHVEVFWNASAGWFTARLVDFFGHLEPPDCPIGASGASPGQALANLHDAVLEWA